MRIKVESRRRAAPEVRQESSKNDRSHRLRPSNSERFPTPALPSRVLQVALSALYSYLHPPLSHLYLDFTCSKPSGFCAEVTGLKANAGPIRAMEKAAAAAIESSRMVSSC